MAYGAAWLSAMKIPTGMGKIFQLATKTYEVMGKKKTQKSMKMAKGIFEILKKGISGQALEILDALMDIFKLFAPIFKPIVAMVKIFIAEVMIQLLPLIMPISKALIKMIPYVRLAGQYTGQFLRWFIGEGGFVNTMKLLWDLFIGFNTFMLKGVIGTLLYLWDLYIKYNNFMLGIFMPVITLILNCIKSLRKYFDKASDAIEPFITWIKDMIDILLTATGRGGGGSGGGDEGLIPDDVPFFGLLHSGTRAVPKTGAYLLKRDEKVSDQADSAEDNNNIIINIDMRDAIIDNRDKLVNDIAGKVWERIG